MKTLVAVFLMLLFASAIFAQKQGEITVTSTFLRQSPDAASEKIRTLPKGEIVVFEKSPEKDGWYYVSVSNGTAKGWVRKETVRRSANAPKRVQTERADAPRVESDPRTAEKTAPPIQTPSRSIISPPAPAPSPAEPEEEVIRIQTEEVNLRVRVIDENNRTVKNLGQNDFKVYEDDVLQPITGLTAAELPIISALVIDNSRSMRSQLGKIIEAGKNIVAANLPSDESTVVRFVGKDKIEVVQDFTPNKALLDNALENLYVEGGQTAIVDAVFQTAKKLDEYQKSQKRENLKIRALILISDGENRSDTQQERELFDLLRQSQVQIYAVGFVNDLSAAPGADGGNRRQRAKDFLTRLSSETGGKVYFPASVADLPQISSEIADEVRSAYLISYTPTNELRDGTFRKLKVTVADGANGEKRLTITRAGRNAPTN